MIEKKRPLRSQAWFDGTGDGGYARLFRGNVLKADRGCDFEFLVGMRGAGIPRPSH